MGVDRSTPCGRRRRPIVLRLVNDTLRIAIIAVIAVMVAKVVLPKVPGLDQFAGRL